MSWLRIVGWIQGSPQYLSFSFTPSPILVKFVNNECNRFKVQFPMCFFPLCVIKISLYRPFPGCILKTLDTICNCQRLAFTVVVSQHMHKITNLWKFELNQSSQLQDNNERKNSPCHTKLCAYRWLISRPQVLNLRSRNQFRGKILLSRKLHGTSEWAVSHNVLYHQPLPITHHKERFFANNYF